MSKLKKIVLLLTLAIMASGSFSSKLSAEEYYTTEVGGCGYQNSVASPSLTPYIILGTVIIIAIVAMAVRHHHHHGNHAHGH